MERDRERERAMVASVSEGEREWRTTQRNEANERSNASALG